VRRIGALLLVLAAVATAATLLPRPARGDSSYTFAAIFDDARGIIPGQLLKIAGANAGSIVKVTITPDFKARIEMTVSRRFAPFRTDAHCTIRPQGLIAENYVDCDPGLPSAPPLPQAGGGLPTVPVSQTTEPVSLLDLFNIANLPTAQRFSILVNELGIGLSGNGQNLNGVILRAVPALSAARRVLTIIHQQRAELATAIDASDSLVAQLAAHTPDISSFVAQAARLTQTTAAHSGPLAQALHELPGLLSAARPALADVDGIALTGTPLVQQIHAAVPRINKLTADLGPFARAVAPVLERLAPVLRQGTKTGHDVLPLVRLIASYATRSLASTIDTGKLFVNLRDHGFAEAFLAAVYYLTAATARFDSTSHFAVSVLGANQCSAYVSTPTPGCDARIGGSATAVGFTPASEPQARMRPLLNYLLKPR
jgi:ABC-type transporter Mla subunit MlaD